MNNRTIIIVIIAAVLSAFLGYQIGQSNNSNDATGIPAPAVEADQQPLFYRNPMNPEVTSPVPAKDHMGMDYIPVYADASAGNSPPGTVLIDPVTVQSIGVRTTTATHRSITRDIHTVGRIAYDETRIVRLHPKTEGWIEELRVQTTGETIASDDILLSLYSPQLVATQQEYLLALANLEKLPANASDQVRASNENLAHTALERLELLDVPAHQLVEIKASRSVKKHLHIHSPSPGTIINVGVRRGQFVTPRTELYFIADLSRVWVYVDIFDDELPWVTTGDSAVMSVNGRSGETLTGNLTHINPYAERDSRSVKARLEFDNALGLLKPDMFVDITIKAQPARHVLAVPSEAILRSGLQDRVFVVSAPGKFEPREVVTGVSGEGWTRINQGVRLGEQVVVSAQFLIDSESKLREAAAKMQATGLMQTNEQSENSPDAPGNDNRSPAHD
jgi:membrane fusion protein, copper/silver efflux system